MTGPIVNKETSDFSLNLICAFEQTVVKTIQKINKYLITLLIF
jgi:hypothetical protein